jgi:hypothetical protein
VLAVSIPAVASAHDTWLAGPAAAAPGATTLFNLTSSGTFPTADHAIEPSRIARAVCRSNGQDAPFRAGARGRQSLKLRARGLPAGVAACGVSLHPRTLDLEAADVMHYLEEIGARDTIGPAWSARTPPAQWREAYVKHAKTFTRVGTRADESWREPLGLGLEIVPLVDPTGLKAGTTFEVRLIKSGQPLAGLALRASRAGAAASFATTDADGRARFTLDAPGPWLLAGTELRASTAKPGEWESDFTTLSLEVGK